MFVNAPCDSELCELIVIDTCDIKEVKVSRGNTDPEVYIVSVKTSVSSYEWSRTTTLDAARFTANSLIEQASKCDNCCCESGC